MVAQRIDHIDADDGAKQRQVQILEEPWGDVVFEEIERALPGGVRLNASQRLTVQIYVELYLFLKRHSSGTPASRADDRRSLDTVIEHLGAALHFLKSSSPMKDRVLFMAHLRAKICPEDQIKVFESLYESCVEGRKAMALPGRKADLYLDQLLEKLELLFLEAGGTSTRISRPGAAPRLRESPFINFVWAVVLQMPESIRPETQALAVRWERIIKKRTRAAPDAEAS